MAGTVLLALVYAGQGKVLLALLVTGCDWMGQVALVRVAVI